MPATNTITAFYFFSPSDRPRVSLLNNNFANFRGNIIPIDPNTATAATTKTYDVGQPEHRFNNSYFDKIFFSTNLSLYINTAGSFVFENNLTSTSLKISSLGIDGIVGGSLTGATISAGLQQIAQSNLINYNTTNTGNILGSTLTVVCSGRPIILYCAPDIFGSTTGAAKMIFGNPTSTGSVFTNKISLHRNNTIVATTEINFSVARTYANGGTEQPLSSIKFLDFPTAGSNIYHISLQEIAVNTTSSINFTFEMQNSRLYATEL